MHPDKNCNFLAPCLLLLTFATLPRFCEQAFSLGGVAVSSFENTTLLFPKAPAGCGQYYTEPSGAIRGWNTDSHEDDEYYLSGLSYAICVRYNFNKCQVRYYLSQI